MDIKDLTETGDSRHAQELDRRTLDERLEVFAPWVAQQPELVHELKRLFKRGRDALARRDLDALHFLIKKQLGALTDLTAMTQRTMLETVRKDPDNPSSRRLLRLVSRFYEEIAWPTIPLEYRDNALQIYARSKAEFTRWRVVEKEPWTVEWIEREFAAGGVLYDIGANVGAYSLVAGAVSGDKGRIFAFEPAYRTYAALIDNVALNRMQGRITALPLALSDRVTMSDMRYRSNESGAGMHGIGDEPVEGMKDFDATLVYPILLYTLDRAVEDFGLPAPNYVKIDVDGHECALLEGARRTLGGPAIRSVLVECSGEERRDQVRRLLGEELGLAEAGEWSSTPELGEEGRVSYLLFERR
ncbi:methyltransferase, FkbM family [Tistlia consotensis]|uniref:Methyltransferase, FkbM family n=1 Tax=Tistlia consotensis USBA 355 TaxID=560819 RepID=A0A1Y6BBF8_9PROT|nr:FkbM family methyltransferase [Tistlia consotensis]SME99188.1 methyltransferase, FkbM family [Tistlia consotensis USBA 355]SNR77312.1 methyltransferase, FkbM family [Tistlia consotensis]